MPFNIVGWGEATPGTGTVNLAGAVGENHYRVVGDDIYVTEEAPYILGVFAISESTGGDILLRQPKMIDYAIKKTSLNADVAAACSYTHYFGRPLPLRVDKLSALIVNATDEDALVGAILGSGKITQQMLDQVNPTHVISGYGDTTVTAFEWSTCPITWNQDLDAGIYEVVGMRCSLFGAATMGIARLLIPGAMNWRPGVPCSLAAADHEEWQSFHYMPARDWPLMGVCFDTEHMPNLEVFSVAANTDENVELTLQKIA